MAKGNNHHPVIADDSRRSRLLRLLSILIGIIAALGLMFASEAGAIWFLKRNSLPTYPIIVNINATRGPKAISPMFAKDVYSAYDPHMGYAHNPAYTSFDYKSLPGFTIYGDGEGKSRTLVVVTLGGSTTDGNVPRIWAQVLQELMAAEGINVQVYNGGVAGYSSSQELLKLIRDVIPLKPDLIISYNGVNDIGLGDALRKHPMVNNYQESIMDYLTHEQPPVVLPNTMTAIKHLPWFINEKRIKSAVNYGPVVDVSPEKSWYKNVRTMHAVSSEFGIPYLCFLQPALGIGLYDGRSVEEEGMLTNAEGSEAEGYMILLEEFYREAREDCQSLDYCENLVDVFAGQTGIYIDKMHTNDEGNRIIAQAVFDVLLKRYPSLKSNIIKSSD